jgi:hypothetical protein
MATAGSRYVELFWCILFFLNFFEFASPYWPAVSIFRSSSEVQNKHMKLKLTVKIEGESHQLSKISGMSNELVANLSKLSELFELDSSEAVSLLSSHPDSTPYRSSSHDPISTTPILIF